MSRVGTLLVAFALFAPGCSSVDPGGADAGAPAGPDDAWFGLADRKCLRFRSAAGLQDFAMEFAVDTTTVTGVRTYHATTRLNGLRQEELWFEVTSDSMLLHRRRAVEDLKDTFYIFAPPPVWMRKGLEVGSNVDSETTARVSGARSGSFPTTFSLVSLVADPVTVAGTAVDATKYTIGRHEAGQSDTIDKFWFAPTVGLVKYDPAGTAIGEETLASASVLAAGDTCD